MVQTRSLSTSSSPALPTPTPASTGHSLRSFSLSLLTPLFSFLHWSLHLLVSLSLSLSGYLQWVRSHCEAFLFAKKPFAEITRLRNLKKLPRHIGLILDETTLSEDLQHLARLINWAIIADIRIITIYDNKSWTKHHLPLLQVAINTQKTLLWNSFGSQLTALSQTEVLVGKEQCLQVLAASPSSGSASAAELPTHLVVVNPISDEDGKHRIVRLTKDYCGMAKRKLLKPEDIKLDAIGDDLNAGLRLPDPDLILKFDSSFCMVPFLPWHIRLTEIFDCGRLSDFDPQSFVSSIRRFAGTEQRFGR